MLPLHSGAQEIEMEIEIAFDIGGTFTDFAVGVDGVIQNRFLKITTSSVDQARPYFRKGINNGIDL